MNEGSIELEEFFGIEDNENEIEINEEEDYLKYNNSSQEEIRGITKKNKPKKKEKKIGKKGVKKEIKLEEKYLEKKQEMQKNKHLLYKLSDFELFVLSLFKKVKWLRENKMIYQILLIYLLSFIFLLLFIIFAKNYIVEKSFVYFEDNNYYTFVDSDVIRTQKVLKLQADRKNSNNVLSMKEEHLLFMEIYTKELVSHYLLNKDGVFRNLNIKETQEYGSQLGINFETTSTIEEMVMEDIEDNHAYNIKNLLPFYYHFVPIINQNLDFFGVKMKNFYFIGNDNKCGQENSKINNLYFKYPLEKNNLGIDMIPLNNKIYDYIIDPFIDCNYGYKFGSEFIELVKENNWYYNIIKEDRNIEIDYRVFKIMKINQENKREDYFIAYHKFNVEINDLEGNILNFLFAIRYSREDLFIPFLIYNEYDDTLLYDYISILNFEQIIKQVNLSNFSDIKSIIHESEYNIDDSKNILLKNTKFIENINFFGMQRKEESSALRILKNYENNKLYSDNSIMIKYEDLDDIQKNYNINYYYEPDVLFFKLLYFFNQFILYKKKHPEYLINDNIINANNSNIDYHNDSSAISEDHPCSISNIDEYYQNIKNKFGYDCIYDYCFYHDCFRLDDLNIKKNNYHLPNCYCIPLFCKDEKTQKNSEFERQIKKKMKNKNNEKFDYSFTSKNDYYLSEKQSTFSAVDDFFNRTDFNFKCQITFIKKNVEENKTFITNIFSYNYKENEKNIILLLFIYNNVKLEQIMKEMHLNLFNILHNIVTAYSILYAFLFISIICYLNFAYKRIINKMNQIKNIRKIIISNSKSSSKNNLENILIKEKSNQKSHINNNEKNNLIDKNKDNNRNNTNASNENEEDEDELDELIKLIINNLSLFNIEFNLNEESNHYLNDIKKQYNEIIQVNKFKNKLLLKEDKDEIILNNSKDNNSIDIDDSSINIKKNIKTDDLSVNILCELLSLSNNKIDFSNIKANFYYNIPSDNSLYDLNKFISNSNEANNINESNEITNIDKLQNALEHYYDNIHEYWKKYYEYQKSKDEI